MFQKLKENIKKSSEVYENCWKTEIQPITGEIYIRPEWFKYCCILIDLLAKSGYCNILYLLITKPFKKGFLLYPDYLIYIENQDIL